MLAAGVQAFFDHPHADVRFVVRVGAARGFVFAIEMQAAIGPVDQPEPHRVGRTRPMFDQIEAALDPWPVTHHGVLAIQLLAVVAVSQSGDRLAIVLSTLCHPHIAAGANHLVVAVVSRHAFGCTQGDGIGGHPPADPERAVADVAAVAQPQRRGKAASGGYGQRQFQRSGTGSTHAAKALANALNSTASFGQRRRIDAQLCLIVHVSPLR
ncbi:hypothetical protein D3C80_1154600 [compost metagenome]